MSTAPLRFVRSRVRWNPFWVLDLDAVELGAAIRRSAARVAGGEEQTSE